MNIKTANVIIAMNHLLRVFVKAVKAARMLTQKRKPIRDVGVFGAKKVKIKARTFGLFSTFHRCKLCKALNKYYLQHF